MTSDINKDMILRVSDNYVVYGGNEQENNYYVFNTASGKISKLNRTSYLMISCIDSKKTLREAFEDVCKKFDKSNLSIEKDFYELMCLLISKNILIEIEN